MKIVQAHTGARAVPVPDEGVILVDPDIGHDTAVNAIQAALPEAHPDAVEHWVEAVLPTVDPLTVTEVLNQTQIQRARQFYRPSRPVDLKPGRHRTHRSRPSLSKPVRIAARSGALVLTGLVGALLSPLVTGGATPAVAETPWQDPVFAAVTAAGAGWMCDTDPQLAECVTDEGIPTRVEVANAASSRTFHFHYVDPDTGTRHQADLKVFKTKEAQQEWVEVVGKARRNVHQGRNWVVYGGDAKRIDKYSKVLQKNLG